MVVTRPVDDGPRNLECHDDDPWFETRVVIPRRAIARLRARFRAGPESTTPAMMMKAGLGPIRLLLAEAAFRAPLQRKNPPRISADGFQAKQFTFTKTHHETGPVKR
jgi:hypothetical protein